MQFLPIDTLEKSFKSELLIQHLVVEAETGSGKSTRLPLWSLHVGRVLVIEPRRIACTSLASFLANEHNEPVGKTIGYAIKLEQYFDANTQVVFVTPGVALRWFAENKLHDFKVVMVDEFHERRWDTDLLVALLNQQQTHRIVLTSATIEGDKLARYIRGKRLVAQGRKFNVAVNYRANDSRQLPDARHLEQRVKAEVVSAYGATQGDILVFLPGRKEIQQCQQALSNIEDLLVLALHASVSEHERELALTIQPQQKVILATNVAETSLTIPNVTVVIDSGLERRTEQRNGRTTLSLKHISKASANQRSGRAGRVMDGTAVRLYGQHAALANVTPPELQREELVEAMLASASCGYPLPRLTFLEPLPEKALKSALTILRQMDAIDEDGQVTEHGLQLAPLPIDSLYADLVTRMPSKALKEAMVDLTAALSVSASLYSLSSNEEALDSLVQQEPCQCDGQLLIRIVRGETFSGVTVDQQVLKEAKGLSAQMRAIFVLPHLDVASRYQRSSLAKEIARLHPELVFVRREKRRDALGNGQMEVMPARNSRFSQECQAALVLDQHSLAGRGVKQTLTLATVMMPIDLAIIDELNLGEWQQDDVIYENGKLNTRLNLIYAGRKIVSRQVEACGEFAIIPLVEAVKNGDILPGLAQTRMTEIAHWRLYVDLGLDETKTSHHNMTFDRWFKDQLKTLEVSSLEDLSIFDVDDFEFDGIPYWQYEDFANTYPFELYLGDLNLSVEYHVAKKLIYLVYKSGLRKGDPKRWELPRWQGFRIQYKKASRIVDIR